MGMKPTKPHEQVARMAGKGNLPLEPNWMRSRAVAIGFTTEFLEQCDLKSLLAMLEPCVPPGTRLVTWQAEEFNRIGWLLLAHPAFLQTPEGERFQRISVPIVQGVHGQISAEEPSWPWDPARKLAWDTGCTLAQAEATLELEKVA